MRRALRFACPLLLSCAHAPTPHPGTAPPSQLDRVVDEYFEAKFAFEPSAGTAAGLHQYDSALEDLSRPRVEARIAELKRFIGRLEALAPAPTETIDARFLTAQARAELFNLDAQRAWQRNPMRYAGLPGEAIDALMKRNYAPAAQRLTAVVARLRAVPALYQAARDNVTNPAPEHTALALRMAKGAIAFFDRAVPTWGRAAAGGDPARLAALEAADAAALEAARGFARWLEQDLAPRARGAYALGEAPFREKLRLEEMVETPLPALLAQGEAQLARDRAAFVATASHLDVARSPAAVMTSLSGDHPTAADLVPSVARALDDARAFVVARGLVTIPSQARPRVEETPAYARAAVFASMDTPGPYETSATEAYYYVTPVEPDWTPEHREQHLRMFNRYTVALINVHEAYPGHFLQFLYAPRFPTKVRKLLATGANVEGWAHYAEQMMIDEGFGGGDPRLRLAQVQEALLRDCRYLVAIKMHTQGMTVADATRFFIDQGFQEPANAHEEALRGTYDPMYLAYTLGKLQIQQLRDAYRARGHTLREFHDAFVAQGGLPIALMRELLLR